MKNEEKIEQEFDREYDRDLKAEEKFEAWCEADYNKRRRMANLKRIAAKYGKAGIAPAFSN